MCQLFQNVCYEQPRVAAKKFKREALMGSLHCFRDKVKNTLCLLEATQHAFSSCSFFLSQDESEVDFHKYPSTSLPDLVSTCSGPDALPSPGEEKENMEPDVEDVRASSLSLPTQDLVCTSAAYQSDYLLLSSCSASYDLRYTAGARTDCFNFVCLFMTKS